MRRLIETMFTRGVSPRRRERLWQHLHTCCDCRAHYDRLAEINRRLRGEQAALSPEQLEHVGRVVMRRIAPPRWWRRSEWLAPGSIAAAAAAAGALVLVTVIAVSSATRDFQDRGGGSGSGIGLRAGCVGLGDQGRPELRAIFPGRPSRPVPLCRIEDLLTFSYTNALRTERGLDHLFVVGVDEHGDIKWYYPQPPETESIAIETGPAAVDRPLPGGIRLSVNHVPGSVRVFGIFTRRPLPLAEVEQALASRRDRGTDVSPSGIAGAEVVTFLVSIER